MKKYFLLLIVLIQVVSLSAIPARPGQWKTLTLVDGSQVYAELKGDEFCHYWMTEAKTCYIESKTSGLYEVANLQELTHQALDKRMTLMNMDKHRTRTMVGDEHEPYIGKKKGLILLVDFTNKKFEDSHTPELYNDMANKVNFTNEMGFVGSIKDYFLAQSGGQFELDFDVVGPLSMPKTYGYYGANTQGNDTNPGQMVATACEMADEFVNFKDYDWDGDGEVDQVFVIYAGLGEAAGGDANTIWPHEWHLQYNDYGKTMTLDDVVIDTYACGPELTLQGYINPTTIIQGIGTICHEFSHCLGLPDVYDTAYGGGYGMQSWDVMASGGYNGNNFIPAGFTSYELMYCGWRNPIELKNDTTITGMKPLSEGGESYIIYNDANKNEYYLLENRQKTGWDAGLPGNGLLVIHVDYDPLSWRYNFVNNFTSYPEYNDHERYTVIAADNSRNSSDVGTDPFPYKDKDSLTNNSLPRAELYNLNPDGIHYTSKPITNIKQENGLISFVFKNNVQNQGTDTGIKTQQMLLPEDQETIYDLHGRNLGTDPSALPKGIYIIGGKKVVR
ncbi:MAG: M6 family metalloprotease domain-containing protein [Prevotella sp.]|nr:M6 family metalloprotease domain-containing protein [Prevotella sp.]